jgi:hypothetical protein
MPPLECIPFKEAATAVTAKASAEVEGKTMVMISGDRTGGGGGGAEGVETIAAGLSTDVENLYKIKVCGAKLKAFGVAAWTAATNAEVKVFVANKGIILPIIAGGVDLVAGEQQESDATGKLIVWGATIASQPNAYSLTKCTKGKDAEVLFY